MTNSIDIDPKKMGLSAPLLKESFTHGSLGEEVSFERLEFLGDSLIESCMTLMLFKQFPDLNEGTLSRWRSVLVNQQTLSKVSNSLGLPQNLRAHSEQLESLKSNVRIQACLFESFCGAVAIEKGLKEAFRFIEECLEPYVEGADQLFKKSDPKTNLQELSQKIYKQTPRYTKDETTGPSHAPSFKVSVWLGDKRISSAEGKSLKEAEQETARIAIKSIEKEGQK